MKKSFLIKDEIHSQLKKYCDEKGLKINKMVEIMIIKYLKDENDKNLPS
jgi:hypothetical protein